MNITLSAEEQCIRRSREYAKKHGTSLNQLIRDYLNTLIDNNNREVIADEFSRLALEHGGVRPKDMFSIGMRLISVVNNMIRSFIDTNIIVYANDTRDPVKQKLAVEVIRRGMISRTAVISIQVLQEFASVALTKLGQREDIVLKQLDLLGNLEIIEPKHTSVCRAVELRKLYGISFWDSLIITSAEESRCDQIISEDLNPGQFYAGATVVNPFK